MKVIKLMYLIDRKMIELRDNVITGDRYVSMKYGPVLCNTLNLIKGNSAFGEEYNYWGRYITTSDYYLKLDENVDEGALKRTFSEDEIDSIDTVIKEHGEKK